MNVLRKSVALLPCVVLLALSAPSQPTVNLCELIRQPEKYNGKLVKVRATWTYVFESSFLHCLGCDGRVWLDTSGIDERSEKTIKHMPKYAGTVNIDVEGIFEAGGNYGHLGGYTYQLMVRTVANPAVIAKGMKAPEEELEIERKSGCGGAKPR